MSAQFLLLAFLVASISISACQIDSGSANSSEAIAGAQKRERILGGTPAGSEIFEAATVGVRTGAQLCSGVLISKRVVATAAHCKSSTSTKVVFAESDLRKPSKILGVKKAINHPNYKASSLTADDIEFDITLLFLDADAPVQPVKIADVSAVKEGDPLTMVGFGMQEDQSSNPRAKSGIKLKVSNKISKLKPNNTMDVEETYGTGTCQGDSGGPAFASVNGEMQLAGLTSSGGECGASEGSYTFVPAYLPWIVQTGGADFSQLNPGSIHPGSQTSKPVEDHNQSSAQGNEPEPQDTDPGDQIEADDFW